MMNDKATESDEVFDGERMLSDINVCTDKHDLDEKHAILLSINWFFDICS